MWKRASPARWLSLCVLALAVAFVGSTIYSRKVALQIDTHSNSITQNGSIGVVLLAKVTEDIRLISTAAMRANTDSLPDSRVKINSWFGDMNQAIAVYRQTEDYPGERDLYLVAEGRFGPFTNAVDEVLNTVGGPPAVHKAAEGRLSSSSDALALAIHDISRLNADQIGREGEAISEARARATEVSSDFRVITLALAVTGILLSWATSRQHIDLVEDSKRFAEERANELELFAGRVAHDLRAPLTVIQMNSSAAEHYNRTPETQCVAFERITRQGRRMGDMIDTLLAFAQAGARPKPGACQNIAEVVKEVASDCQPMATEAGVELIVEPLPQAAVACSPSVLGIILSNLVRNAIKYIGDNVDTRRVTIRMRERERSLLFEVADTGPGLPRGMEDRVFEPFVRVSAARDGIGLGLATVKRLVEGHRGRVSVQSVPGRGCRFRFELPRAPSSPSPDRSSDPTLPSMTSAPPASARL